MPTNRQRIYCGRRRKLTREHVVPDALGAAKWTKSVCAPCNGELLSPLDKELAEESPLSLVAAFELQKKMKYSWDVDHEDNNLLLEASADETSQSMTRWPQMVFEEGGPQLRGDAEEIQRFGWDDFQTVFVRQMLAAFATFKSGAKRPRIIFERVSDDIPKIYRYASRVFSTRRIADFDGRMRFQCRYTCDADKRRVLRSLGNWGAAGRFRSQAIGLGSALPAFKSNFELTAVLRGLVKIGINLLYWSCDKTPVDRGTLEQPIKVVTGETPVRAGLLALNGFVHVDDIAALQCKPGEHHFRLVYDTRRGSWHIYFGFFGGRIGATVWFPGPSNEQWLTADITAPIENSNWSVRKSPIYLPIRTRVEWADLSKVIPSVPFVNRQTVVTVVSRGTP